MKKGTASESEPSKASDENSAKVALFCFFTIFFTAILRNSFQLGIKLGLTRSNDAGYFVFGIMAKRS